MDALKQIEQDWEDLAHIDPMWAIVSDPARQYGKWDPDEFFESGRRRVDRLFGLLEQQAIPVQRAVCLDFGCGMGRYTQALAARFERCQGLDISPQMIKLSQQHNRFGDRVQYALNPSSDLRLFEGGRFDFVFTSAVLQHMPPQLMRHYLEEFCRVLKPDGVAVVEVPTRQLAGDARTNRLRQLPRYHPARIWNKLRSTVAGPDPTTTWYYRLRRLGLSRHWLYGRLKLRPKIPMYVLAEDEIAGLARQGGRRLAVVTRFEYEGLEVSTVAILPA
jgi:SAM-dependent methyltransferase